MKLTDRIVVIFDTWSVGKVGGGGGGVGLISSIVNTDEKNLLKISDLAKVLMVASCFFRTGIENIVSILQSAYMQCSREVRSDCLTADKVMTF